MPTDDPRQRLLDIEDNTARIFAHVDGMTQAAFVANPMAVDAVERCLERIAEAARKLGDRYDAAYPELKLHRLRQFGSVLRHDYDAVAPESLWVFIEDTLPGLRRMAETELARFEYGGDHSRRET